MPSYFVPAVLSCSAFVIVIAVCLWIATSVPYGTKKRRLLARTPCKGMLVEKVYVPPHPGVRAGRPGSCGYWKVKYSYQLSGKERIFSVSMLAAPPKYISLMAGPFGAYVASETAGRCDAEGLFSYEDPDRVKLKPVLLAFLPVAACFAAFLAFLILRNVL